MLRQIEQASCIVIALVAALSCSSERRAASPPRAELMRDPDAALGADGGQDGGEDTAPPLSAAGAGPTPPAANPLVLSEAERCPLGCEPAPSPLEQETRRPHDAPPALSGGTLLTTRDKKWLVAADPDRDRVYFVDIERRALSHVRKLGSGAEPGRLIEDDSGRIHVALRGGGALLTLTRAADGPMTERALCPQPRGLAYDSTTRQVHIACAGGELVSIAADPGIRTFHKVDLERDLRDVIVRAEELLVTRFRSAELLRVGADGSVRERLRPPTFLLREPIHPSSGELSKNDQAPTVAWRAIDIPGKGSALLHQRARVGPVKTTMGGYTSLRCGGAIQTAVTIGLDAERAVSADLRDVALAVDMAASPDANLLAVVSPAGRGSARQLAVFSLTGTSALNPHAPLRPLSQSLLVGLPPLLAADDPERRDQVCIEPRTRFPTPHGQVTSVSFVGDRKLALLQREPAAISIVDLVDPSASFEIDLRQETRRDTGYDLFHMPTPAGLACASCHAEAGDDAHVWTFEALGARRTQSLRGGILGTEPLHWDGDMADFGSLVSDVFRGRMLLGEPVAEDQVTALATWIDAQPRMRSGQPDGVQVERGKALFESAAVGCAACHGGPLFTNNQRVDVGTGAAFQVPALRGVSFRLPLMHDGCAKTMAERFDAACGGEAHGNTGQLSAGELDDLIAYLNTL